MSRDEFEKVRGHSSWQRVTDDDCIDKIVPVSQCFSTRNTRDIWGILNARGFVHLGTIDRILNKFNLARL